MQDSEPKDKSSFEVFFPQNCKCCAKKIIEDDWLVLLLCCSTDTTMAVAHHDCWKAEIPFVSPPGTPVHLWYSYGDRGYLNAKLVGYVSTRNYDCSRGHLRNCIDLDCDIKFIKTIDPVLAVEIRKKISTNAFLGEVTRHFTPLHFLAKYGNELSLDEVKRLLGKRLSGAHTLHDSLYWINTNRSQPISNLFAQYQPLDSFQYFIMEWCREQEILDSIMINDILTTIQTLKDAENRKNRTDILMARLCQDGAYFGPRAKWSSRLTLWDKLVQHAATGAIDINAQECEALKKLTQFNTEEITRNQFDNAKLAFERLAKTTQRSIIPYFVLGLLYEQGHGTFLEANSEKALEYYKQVVASAIPHSENSFAALCRVSAHKAIKRLGRNRFISLLQPKEISMQAPMQSEPQTNTDTEDGLNELATTPLHTLAREWLGKNIDMATACLEMTHLIQHELASLTQEVNGINYTEKVVYHLVVKDTEGNTPLLLMMKHCLGLKSFTYAPFRDLLMLCLNHGADVNACDNKSKTALHLIFEKGLTVLTEEELIDFLQLMAQHKADFAAVDKAGISPLHLAAALSTEAVCSTLFTKVSNEAFLRCAVNEDSGKSLFASILRNKSAGLQIMKIFASKLLKSDCVFICDTTQTATVWVNLLNHSDAELRMAFQSILISEGTAMQIFYTSNCCYYYWEEPAWAANIYGPLMAKLFTAPSYSPQGQDLKIIEAIVEFSNTNPRCHRQILTPAENAALCSLWGINGTREDIPKGLEKLEALVRGAKTRADSLVPCVVLGRHYAASSSPRAFEFYQTACELIHNVHPLTPVCREFAVQEIEKLVLADFVPALLVRAGVRKRKGEDIPGAAKDYCQFLLRCAADEEAKREAVQGLIALSDAIKQQSLCSTLIVATLAQLIIDKRLSNSATQALLRAFDLDRFFDKHPFRPNFQRTEIGFFSSVFGSDPEYSCRLSLLYLRIATESEQNFQSLKEQITTPNPSASQVATSHLLTQLLDAEQAAPSAGVLVLLPSFLRTHQFTSRLEDLRSALEAHKAQFSCRSPIEASK